MAVTMVRNVASLEAGCILAPERYDQRRFMRAGEGTTLRLRDVVDTRRATIKPGASVKRCLVLDTSDAREGLVATRKACTDTGSIGSHKKVMCVGDVIISRLRPYLRQVALLDDALCADEEIVLACSTEFFVLYSPIGEDIAFLVPFLLSAPVQAVLAASQEGGHHPRFNEDTLLNLPLPRSLMNERKSFSNQVRKSTRLFRDSEQYMSVAVTSIGEQLQRAETTDFSPQPKTMSN